MENVVDFLEKIKYYGIGCRKLDDDIFINDKPPPRLGVYDMDDENLCHEVVKTTCNIPGCNYIAESLLEFEDHYNSSHRYSCAQCKKVLPSPHFLDLHLEESHDSFFAVMAERKPSYCCYIEECIEKFMTTDERHDHCVKIHKLPKDFRFEQKTKCRKKESKSNDPSMDLDSENITKVNNKIIFSNNKQKTFPKYTGRKFTKNNESKTTINVDSGHMEISVEELKKSLP